MTSEHFNPSDVIVKETLTQKEMLVFNYLFDDNSCLLLSSFRFFKHESRLESCLHGWGGGQTNWLLFHSSMASQGTGINLFQSTNIVCLFVCLYLQHSRVTEFMDIINSFLKELSSVDIFWGLFSLGNNTL